jgi:predicted dehydrogenase
MSTKPLRIGLIGAGGNTKLRHIPGFNALPEVRLVAVCNRRPESSAAVAKEYGILKTYEHWQELVDSPDIDAIVIGTWPYLHCPITLASLNSGKHVLTEARMAMNATEAHQMLAAAQRHSNLIAQVVPSPYGMRAHDVVKELIESDFLGELREMHVYGLNAGLADPATPLSWRQDAALSGYNMLILGILHETVARWVAPVKRVMAQVHAFIPARIDPQSGVRRGVGTPDSVQALTVHEDGMRGLYQFSGVAHASPGMGVRLFGGKGTVWYDISGEKLYTATSDGKLSEIPVPAERARDWTVEADFVASIREGKTVEFTDFESGAQYMEFTEAVARSAQTGIPVELPLGIA